MKKTHTRESNARIQRNGQKTHPRRWTTSGAPKNVENTINSSEPNFPEVKLLEECGILPAVGRMALSGAVGVGAYNYFKSGETATGSSAEVVTCSRWNRLDTCMQVICDRVNVLEATRKQTIKYLTISTTTGVINASTHAGLFFGSGQAKSPLTFHLVESDFWSGYNSFIQKVSRKMSKTNNIVSVCADSYDSSLLSKGGKHVWYCCIFYRDKRRKNDNNEARQKKQKNDMQSRIEARQQKKQNNEILKKYKSMLELDDVLDERSLEKEAFVWVGENGDIRENKNGQLVGWATKDGEAFGDFLPFTENRMQKDPRLQKKQKRRPNDMRSRIEARMKKSP